jgi:hypothetical protein
MNSRYRISRVTTPAASMALVSLADAKAYLGITDNTQDAAITQQIAQVSAAINHYCDRVLVQQTYEDTFRALYAWPITESRYVSGNIRWQSAPLP